MNLVTVNDEATKAPIVNIDPVKLEEIQIDRLKWANRRMMAWVSLYAIIIFLFVFVAIGCFNGVIFERIIHGTDLITWIIGFISMPIITYGGGTAAQTITQAFSKNKTG